MKVKDFKKVIFIIDERRAIEKDYPDGVKIKLGDLISFTERIYNQDVTNLYKVTLMERHSRGDCKWLAVYVTKPKIREVLRG